MSKSIFPGCDGTVARIDMSECSSSDALFKIYINTGTQIAMPVTGFALEVGGNYQFLHTVSDFVYFYTFGDRVGELNVTGMAFTKRACNANTGGLFGFFGATHETGICDVWDFYSRYKASVGKPLNVTWGTCEAFHGFLTGMRVEIATPEVPVAQYVLRIHIVNRK